MTDPVDTDALRDVTRNEGLWEAEASLITAAADEVDRLRTELAEGLSITKQHAKDSARERRLLERDVHRLRLAWEEAESARSAAAAYGERLRAVIENAPHEDLCKAANGWPEDECDCWKAAAL